jgi:hypothetical protein
MVRHHLSISAAAASTTPTHSTATSNVVEGTSGDTITATVTVTRTGAVSVTSSVDLALGGTATEGASDDYTFALENGSAGSFDGTTLSFAAGETTSTFMITVQGDAVVEPDETVSVTLSNATAPEETTIDPANVTLTIQDDDYNVYLPLIIT